MGGTKVWLKHITNSRSDNTYGSVEKLYLGNWQFIFVGPASTEGLLERNKSLQSQKCQATMPVAHELVFDGQAFQHSILFLPAVLRKSLPSPWHLEVQHFR